MFRADTNNRRYCALKNYWPPKAELFFTGLLKREKYNLKILFTKGTSWRQKINYYYQLLTWMSIIFIIFNVFLKCIGPLLLLYWILGLMRKKKSEICLIVWAKKCDDNYDKDNCDLSPYKLQLPFLPLASVSIFFFTITRECQVDQLRKI